MKKEHSARERNKALKWVLGGLVVVAIVLVVVIAAVVTKNNWENDADDASVRAMELAESIDERLSKEPGYNPPQAIAEYDKAYNEAEGSYKVYLAVRYAKYLCETLEDCESAMDVMDTVTPEDNWDEQVTYYMEMIDLYKRKENVEQVQYYSQLLDYIAEEDEAGL